MKTKFTILIGLVLLCSLGVLGQTVKSSDDQASSQNRETEFEKHIRTLVNNNQYIYIAKVASKVRYGYLVNFPGRDGRSNNEPLYSYRLLVEKNLKGPAEKLIKMRDENLKKGARYLIFSNNDHSLKVAVNLAESTAELKMVEKILAEK